MTDRLPRDGVPSVEELIGHTLLIANIGQKSFEDCQLAREETRTALKEFKTTNEKMIGDVATQANYLKESYAPAAVQKAAKGSQTAMREFKAEADSVLDRLDKTTARVTSRFVVRIAIIMVLVASTAACIVWLLLQRVPTLTEIADRQATLQRLQEQIGAFESLKGRLVRDAEGQWYVQYDGPPVKSCLKSNPNDCVWYMRIPK